MKILYFGGQKSGKSNLAEQKALELSKNTKPFYVATYSNNFNDKEMIKRIELHIQQRQDKFDTIEEPFELIRAFGSKLSELERELYKVA